jgi:enoyl-CoA hydratase/carnithine racemase
MALPQFTTLSLEVRPEGYAVLELSRPAKSNAVSTEMWDELPQACSNLPTDWSSAVALCHCLPLP